MGKVIVTGTVPYSVERRVGGTDCYTTYLASREDKKDEEFLLKIAIDVGHNGTLDREAFLLKELRERALQLEVEYSHVNPGAVLNYQLGFPNLIETFVAREQGGRRVLILAFDAADHVGDLVSLSMIRERLQMRVDPKTSAWIMGKTLKILDLAHSENIEVGSITGDDILIVREHHLVTLSDWSQAIRHPGKIPHATLRAEIASAAREVVIVLGGDPNTGIIPNDEQLKDDEYTKFLTGLMRGRYHDAHAAHSAFYQLVEAHWPRKFHPYTAYSI
jgi:hypothetical protein